ncbi:Uma2 family endonuclease [Chondromyces apiculatus]|uniref:Putative restriction endonuclease domain-containing protein n=1 Tax=Chondromyces apiculatus DSM 436 TaxID=1192034 RepID=A0A017TI83_9BACT|nr:Uma2 family endonuclease [Chondromyces apiculatus]EYF08530.1 Hypothetical protein CAP_4060 [Chondromyces apiculatus DSM 436]
MGQPAEKRPRPATTADLAAVPEHLVAEIVDGELYTFARPGTAHTVVASRLGMDLGGPFDRGRGGPGGWNIIDEPQLHLWSDGTVLIPDLAGWRRERMPRPPRTGKFTLVPDWICEILSPSTATHDRIRKMPLYAAVGVTWVWLIDPLAGSLEVYHLGPGGRWVTELLVSGNITVSAPPFDAVPQDLGALWVEEDEGETPDDEG